MTAIFSRERDASQARGSGNQRDERDAASSFVKHERGFHEPVLSVLTDLERRCLERYVELLVGALGGRLEEIWLFGSVARGERWPRGMPIRSDLDLLVLTDAAIGEREKQMLFDATYPLFLESGRQIGPQFRTRADLERPKDERAATFLENVRRDAILLWDRSDPGPPAGRRPSRSA